MKAPDGVRSTDAKQNTYKEKKSCLETDEDDQSKIVRVWAISDETPGSTTRKKGGIYLRAKARESIQDILAALCMERIP